MKRAAILATLALALFGAGCEDGFAPVGDVDGQRTFYIYDGDGASVDYSMAFRACRSVSLAPARIDRLPNDGSALVGCR